MMELSSITIAVMTTFFTDFQAINILDASKTTITDSGLAYLGAGVTGVGMVGASIGQGIVGAGACVAIGRNPEASKKIMNVMFIMAGFSESGAIYALLIGILLMFVLV